MISVPHETGSIKMSLKYAKHLRLWIVLFVVCHRLWRLRRLKNVNENLAVQTLPKYLKTFLNQEENYWTYCQHEKNDLFLHFILNAGGWQNLILKSKHSKHFQFNSYKLIGMICISDILPIWFHVPMLCVAIPWIENLNIDKPGLEKSEVNHIDLLPCLKRWNKRQSIFIRTDLS